MERKTLESGWTLLRLSSVSFAQVPPGFHSQTIPDEYIFDPEWNRDAINAAWAHD